MSFNPVNYQTNLTENTCVSWQDGGPLCDPDSWFQGHGVWHFACAVAEWFVFLYLRSEKVHDPNAIQERVETMDC